MLPIIPEKKIGFLLFGKCGSSSIRYTLAQRLLDEPEMQNVYTTGMYFLISEIKRQKLDHYTWYAVTRHPVDRMISAYKQLRFWPRDFDKFLNKVEVSEDYHCIGNVQALTRHGLLDELDVKVVQLEDTKRLEKLVGCKLPHYNRDSSHALVDFSIADLTDKQIRRIETMRADDMKFGGYKSKLI